MPVVTEIEMLRAQMGKAITIATAFRLRDTKRLPMCGLRSVPRQIIVTEQQHGAPIRQMLIDALGDDFQIEVM